MKKYLSLIIIGLMIFAAILVLNSRSFHRISLRNNRKKQTTEIINRYNELVVKNELEKPSRDEVSFYYIGDSSSPLLIDFGNKTKYSARIYRDESGDETITFTDLDTNKTIKVKR